MSVVVFILPLILLVAGLISMKFDKSRLLGKIWATAGLVFTAVIYTLIGALLIAFSSKHSTFYISLTVIVSILLCVLFVGLILGFGKNKRVYMPIVICLLLCMIAFSGHYGYQSYVDSIPTIDDSGNLLWQYLPYGEDTKVANLDGEATLKISDDIPRLDGATALYPIYSAFAKAVYPESALNEIQLKGNEILNCSTTGGAYERIVTGDADIIFVGGPSKEQTQFAKENNVELMFTPIGKEAFVFFVNSNNPLENITLEQIQDIYSGKIKKWEQLGVEGFGNIRAFQREEGSGSQTAILKIMNGKELMTPPEENVIAGMGGIISKTADYKNYKNAIGYSFRYYSNEMVNNNQIKLLKINGIAPTLENIENGTYPIFSEFFAVTRSDATDNTKKFVQWATSSQGQELVEKTGYTPLN
ncbi:MAG: substrate-binding domain-containing protein [Clostridia bacterium]|nr:substrate-binding domain-containing protein [Clostridia bacterium]